ncbi:hypothetical protein KYK29_09845 [Shinella daejeonensis]|uniref:DUF6074 family protein n=1 Tax=Shinella daejeonensis TaxID=659017 RepID=UPI0020C75288|nr:DUF6074 family protein [Shinella daejeonensis]MCP8895235.1 hypothetical protein [Shinella daejeonensis]
MSSHASAQRRRSTHSSAAGVNPVVPFPVDRRIAHVRRCAHELDALHGEEARLYWIRVCRELAEELRRLGSSDADLRAAVFSFQDEVQRELAGRGQPAAEGA